MKAPFCENCGAALSEIAPSENMFHQFSDQKPKKVSPLTFWSVRLFMSLALFACFCFLVKAVVSADLHWTAGSLLLGAVLVIYTLYLFKMTKHPISDD